MTIRFFAYYRDPEYAGCKELDWPETPTLRRLGEELCERFGAKLREEFFTPDGSALGEKIIVMVNGRRAEFLQGLDTPLQQSDTVQIFPIVAGG